MTRIVSAFLICFVLIGVIACGGGHSTPPPTPTPAPALTVTPSSTSVTIGSSQTFSANPPGVTWAVTSGPGTINQSGIYFAPSTFPGTNADKATITATSGAGTATANVTVVFQNDNASTQSGPIKLGTSGGNVNDVTTNACCIGTLGSLIKSGTAFFVLSNNHVLDRSGQGVKGENIDHPGPLGCPTGSPGIHVADLVTPAPALKPATSGGNAPSNVDAAIAQIASTSIVDNVAGVPTGTILDLGPAGNTSIAAAPPSAAGIVAPAIGIQVGKSGRTTGLTCGTIASINNTVNVGYSATCGGATTFTATFGGTGQTGQIAVSGVGFSGEGDSGSLIVASDTSRPVGLLYARSQDGTLTFANPVQQVLDVLNSNGTAPAASFVGGGDHSVSCAPTSVASSTKVGASTSGQFATLSVQERQRVEKVRQSHEMILTRDPAVASVTSGVSMDARGEGALEVHVRSAPKAPLPAVIDGVRTRIIYEGSAAAIVPSTFSLTSPAVVRASDAKAAHLQQFMSMPGIQGMGVTRSDDDPADTAIIIYTIKGVSHGPIPATIDGVRTKVVETAPFRAS